MSIPSRAEIEHLEDGHCPGSRVEQEILRLDVPVNDPLRVRGFECRQDLPGVEECLGCSQPHTFLELVVECAALQVFHHNERPAALGGIEVRYRDNVRVLHL